MKQTISIRPRYIFKILLTIIFVLLLAHIMYMVTTFLYGYSFRELFRLFNFNDEGNFPTFYSVIAILFAALLLLIVGMMKRSHKVKDGNYWVALSGIFVFLAFDEAAQVHERFNSSVRPYLPEESYNFLYWAWVIPYAILSLIIAFSFLKFLTRLPRKTAVYFVIAGGVFVTGAIGLELFNSYYFINEGQDSFGLHLAFTLEELLEMVGIAFFIYAILDYMKTFMGDKFEFAFKTDANVADIKSFSKKQAILDKEEVLQKYRN